MLIRDFQKSAPAETEGTKVLRAHLIAGYNQLFTALEDEAKIMVDQGLKSRIRITAENGIIEIFPNTKKDQQYSKHNFFLLKVNFALAEESYDSIPDYAQKYGKARLRDSTAYIRILIRDTKDPVFFPVTAGYDDFATALLTECRNILHTHYLSSNDLKRLASAEDQLNENPASTMPDDATAALQAAFLDTLLSGNVEDYRRDKPRP